MVYDTLEVFFFIMEFGTEVFQRTDWLSPKIKDGFCTIIPVILNLYRRLRRYSQHCTHCHEFTTKRLVSREDCFLENQKIGTPLRYTTNPVLDLWVRLTPAKSSSTKAQIVNSFPIAIGVFPGNSSLISPQKCFQICCLNKFMSISRYVGSSTNLELWCCYK